MPVLEHPSAARRKAQRPVLKPFRRDSRDHVEPAFKGCLNQKEHKRRLLKGGHEVVQQQVHNCLEQRQPIRRAAKHARPTQQLWGGASNLLMVRQKTQLVATRANHVVEQQAPDT